MHDPLLMLFRIKPLRLDVWHREPGGHDAGTVCVPPPHGWRQVVFAAQHWRHLYPRWWMYLNIKKWIVDRCDHCGRRFRWRESRYSYMSTDKVWHDPCMALRHVRSELDDITRYVQGTADSTTRWRVEHRLKHLERELTPATSDQPTEGE